MRTYLAAVVSLFLCSLVATSAYGRDFCKTLTSAMAPDANKQISLKPPTAPAVECKPVLTQAGVTAQHCAWGFEYRSNESAEFFETLFWAVSQCIGVGTKAEQDQSVSHPDFYDLRVFSTQEGEVGVSIKDKGALQQTYVFLRVQAAKQ
jgi:hypothetical protein